MPIHEAYARVTPYELSFPDPGWARGRFAAIREEATARGVDAGDATAFVLLATAGSALRELRPEGEPAELIELHGLLLYHAFHFWEAGEEVFLLETAVVRRLVEAPGPGPWRGAGPGPGGYVQLPQHLVWTGGDEGQPPESLDGFFWTAPPGRGEVSALLSAGIRRDRPGFSVVPLPAAPVGDADAWLRSEGGGEPDLRGRMPGAELEGLYQLRTTGEALAFVFRALSFLEGAARGGEELHSAVADGPPPSRLPYRKVALD